MIPIERPHSTEATIVAVAGGLCVGLEYGGILLTWFTRTMRRRQLLLFAVIFGPVMATGFILLDAADAIRIITTSLGLAVILYVVTTKSNAR